MSDIFFLLILCIAAVVFIAWLLSTLNRFSAKIHAKAHRAYFLVRWWLIGKYHCDIPPSYKKFWYIMNRVFWIVIFLCVAYTLFVGILGW